MVDEIEAIDGYFSQFQPAALEARVGPLLIVAAVALASPVSAGILLATLVPFAAIMALAGGAAAAGMTSRWRLVISRRRWRQGRQQPTRSCARDD